MVKRYYIRWRDNATKNEHATTYEDKNHAELLRTYIENKRDLTLLKFEEKG